ncbi:MAG: cytochrome c maturation protein CcmE [Lysobacteraceae bacterium]|jgi:cytochrome c-type biogenesis protein CcmE
MNPVRRRRLATIGLVLLAATVSVAIIAWALSRNLTFLYTPSEVLAAEAPIEGRFRLGGVVCEGSIAREPGTLRVDFRVTDRAQNLPVHFEGILPDLFSEGESVIATGRMDNGRFVADDVLAKHDETYMPAEVAEKMAQAMTRPDSDGCEVY